MHLWLISVAIAVAGLMLAGAIYEQCSRRLNAKRFPAPGLIFDVNGHKLHLLAKGTGMPAVIIEQGAGGPALAWSSIQDKLAAFTCVCLYDRAGYGWSEHIPGPRSLEDRVCDWHALLTAAKIPAPYVLVGHSYGGFLVRLFARNYPDEVAGLVLVDSPHEGTYFQPEVLSFYSKMTWMMGAMKILALVGLPRLLTRLLNKPDPAVSLQLSEQINAAMVRNEYFSAAGDDIASLRRATQWLTKAEAFAPLGDLPITVITHGQPFPGPFAVLDKGWREGQDRLAALSTNSVLLVAEKSNHMIHADEPDLVIGAIREVVERARQQALALRQLT